MNRTYTVLLAIALMAVLPACATTKQEVPAPTATRTIVSAADKPGGIIAESIVETAVVDAINYENRSAILKDSENELHFFKADPEVLNFDQLKVGDEVIMEHTESIAIFVDKPEGAPAGTASQVVRRALPGTKPGMEAVTVIEVTALVEKIDYATRMITLKGPEGKFITTKVDPGLTRFNEIKKGDMIYMRLTEELLIKVEKPKKK